MIIKNKFLNKKIIRSKVTREFNNHARLFDQKFCLVHFFSQIVFTEDYYLLKSIF